MTSLLAPAKLFCNQMHGCVALSLSLYCSLPNTISVSLSLSLYISFSISLFLYIYSSVSFSCFIALSLNPCLFVPLSSSLYHITLYLFLHLLYLLYLLFSYIIYIYILFISFSISTFPILRIMPPIFYACILHHHVKLFLRR